jgi:hypothetical protein
MAEDDAKEDLDPAAERYRLSGFDNGGASVFTGETLMNYIMLHDPNNSLDLIRNFLKDPQPEDISSLPPDLLKIFIPPTQDDHRVVPERPATMLRGNPVGVGAGGGSRKRLNSLRKKKKKRSLRKKRKSKKTKRLNHRKKISSRRKRRKSLNKKKSQRGGDTFTSMEIQRIHEEFRSEGVDPNKLYEKFIEELETARRYAVERLSEIEPNVVMPLDLKKSKVDYYNKCIRLMEDLKTLVERNPDDLDRVPADFSVVEEDWPTKESSFQDQWKRYYTSLQRGEVRRKATLLQLFSWWLWTGVPKVCRVIVDIQRGNQISDLFAVTRLTLHDLGQNLTRCSEERWIEAVRARAETDDMMREPLYRGECAVEGQEYWLDHIMKGPEWKALQGGASRVVWGSTWPVIICQNSIISTTTKKDEAIKFATTGSAPSSYVYVFDGTLSSTVPNYIEPRIIGTDPRLSLISLFPVEGEVLLARSNFYMVRRWYKQGGITYIHLLVVEDFSFFVLSRIAAGLIKLWNENVQDQRSITRDGGAIARRSAENKAKRQALTTFLMEHKGRFFSGIDSGKEVDATQRGALWGNLKDSLESILKASELSELERFIKLLDNGIGKGDLTPEVIKEQLTSKSGLDSSIKGIAEVVSGRRLAAAHKREMAERVAAAAAAPVGRRGRSLPRELPPVPPPPPSLCSRDYCTIS